MLTSYEERMLEERRFQEWLRNITAKEPADCYELDRIPPSALREDK